MKRFLAALILLCLAATGARAQTLPEMAGQMLLVGFQGDSLGDPGVQAVIEDIAAGRIGGVMYLKHNVSSLDEVRRMNAAFQAASPPGHPVLIALDQEGGSIERLTEAVGFEEIPSAEVLGGELYTLESAAEIYAGMAMRLKNLGFNLNLGPVVDVNVNPNNPIIARYGRSYGRDPGVVTEYARAFIVAHHAAGVLTALKHFPGHGSSTTDSHEGFVDISTTWKKDDELRPYYNLVGEGIVDMVMPGHLYSSWFAVDEENNLPASLSPNWVGLLRTEIGFQGAVITDDMEMSAVLDLFELEDRVIQAVKTGDDILLFSNTANYRTTIGQQIQKILADEAAADPSFAIRIEESYRRIMVLKDWLQTVN